MFPVWIEGPWITRAREGGGKGDAAIPWRTDVTSSLSRFLFFLWIEGRGGSGGIVHEARETDLLGPGDLEATGFRGGFRRGGLQMRDGLAELSGGSVGNAEVEKSQVLMDWWLETGSAGSPFFGV